LSARRRAAALAAVALAFAVTGACREEKGSAEELCTEVAERDFAGTLTGFDPTDSELALDQLRSARVDLGDLLDAAPNEVRDDLQVEIDYVQALIDALEPIAPGDAAAATRQVQAVTAAHPDVDEAAAALAAFTERECD
jgi:hypothetical protein